MARPLANLFLLNKTPEPTEKTDSTSTLSCESLRSPCQVNRENVVNKKSVLKRADEFAIYIGYKLGYQSEINNVVVEICM